MPTIGGITVLTMRGSPVPRGTEVEEIDRTGVDGQIFFVRGARSPAVRIETVETFQASGTSVSAKKAAYKAIQGTVVSITDAHGTTWTNCLIAGVEMVVVSVTGSSAGSSHDKMITAVWSVVKLGATT